MKVVILYGLMCFVNNIPYDHIPELDTNCVIFYTDERTKNIGKSIQCKCFCHFNVYFKNKEDGLYNYSLSDYNLHVNKYGKNINISIVPIPQNYDTFHVNISAWWCILNTEYSLNVFIYWIFYLKIFWLLLISIIFIIFFYSYNLPQYNGDYMKKLFNNL